MNEELSERQKFILTLVIHDYVQNTQPIGSQYLVDHYNLDMSPATVRNELAALDEAGFLYQPHTSAGRLPSDEGYRYFVGKLLQETELPMTTQRTISHQFYQSRQDVEQWMKLAASVLAHQSRGASIVTSPHSVKARIKHLELIATRGRQVLLVVVLVGGEIHQQMLNLAEPVSQEQLSASASRLSQLCQGMDVPSIKKLVIQLSPLEEDVLKVIIQELDSNTSAVAGELYMDGLTNVLAEPEFVQSEDARKALRLLEERSLLDNLLTRTVLNTNIGGVQVLIGGEGNWEELKQCSVILAKYGVPGMVTGTLGVIGPTRMYYGRSISAVRFMAGLLTGLVNDSMVE
jgi:heat-inducible transcriptional repressor